MKDYDKTKAQLIEELTSLRQRLAELGTTAIEHQLSMETLKESEEKYRLLFEHTDALVSVYNRQGVCQLMNHRVADLFGGNPKDFIGKSFNDLHPQAAHEYTKRIQQAIGKL